MCSGGFIRFNPSKNLWIIGNEQINESKCLRVKDVKRTLKAPVTMMDFKDLRETGITDNFY